MNPLPGTFGHAVTGPDCEIPSHTSGIVILFVRMKPAEWASLQRTSYVCLTEEQKVLKVFVVSGIKDFPLDFQRHTVSPK